MWSFLLVIALLATARSKQLPASTELSTVPAATVTPASTPDSPLDILTVHCGKESMDITVSPAHPSHLRDARFNGIVYPAGLGTNSSCLREYVSKRGDLQYTVPLRGCNTMSVDHDDDTVEYYNNIIVQPHLKLVTGQGRGYHVRCRYHLRDLWMFHVYPKAARLTSGDTNNIDDEFDLESGWMPSVSMKIYVGDPKDKHVASEVNIGETLTMVVSLEKQQRYGFLVSECVAGDGMGSDVGLIADDGCPLDGEIMGMFQYGPDRQEARVSFEAYRFPHSASVYFTCGVKLCELNHPTDCKPCSNKPRARRDTDGEGSPATVQVFSGLFVNEADDNEVTSEKKEDEICISQRNFAIGICIAGIILMICVIAAIACILARRRNPKTYSRTGSSLYSGPYTNTGYSHTS